jgi:hypothetical protein
MRAGLGLPLAQTDRAMTPAVAGRGVGVGGSAGLSGGVQIGPGTRVSEVADCVAQPPSTSKVPPRKSRRVVESDMQLNREQPAYRLYRHDALPA